MTTLPSFRITLNDGSYYVTSMAAGVTLAAARSYFLGQRQVSEDADGAETVRTVTSVEAA